MSSIDINSFVKILTNGLKFYLKNEKVKIEESDFQILENELFSEFSLPYIDQTQTPTQFLNEFVKNKYDLKKICLLYTSPSPRDKRQSRMPSSA